MTPLPPPDPELFAKAIATVEESQWATNHVVRRDLEREALSRLWSMRQLWTDRCCALSDDDKRSRTPVDSQLARRE